MGIGASVTLILLSLWNFYVSDIGPQISTDLLGDAAERFADVRATERIVSAVVTDVLQMVDKVDQDLVLAAENQIVVLVAYRQHASDENHALLTDVSYGLQELLYQVTDEKSDEIAAFQESALERLASIGSESAPATRSRTSLAN
jgi:hypothetical protein